MQIARRLKQKEFIEWWDEREDIASDKDRARWTTCPIALYLRAHGFPDATVDSDFWKLNPDSPDLIPLPIWAERFVRMADAMKKPYKGLPEGFVARGLPKPR